MTYLAVPAVRETPNSAHIHVVQDRFLKHRGIYVEINYSFITKINGQSLFSFESVDCCIVYSSVIKCSFSFTGSMVIDLKNFQQVWKILTKQSVLLVIFIFSLNHLVWIFH